MFRTRYENFIYERERLVKQYYTTSLPLSYGETLEQCEF